jgi:hypothetical protein
LSFGQLSLPKGFVVIRRQIPSIALDTALKSCIQFFFCVVDLNNQSGAELLRMGAAESYLRVARSYPFVRPGHRRASPLTDRPKLLLWRGFEQPDPWPLRTDPTTMGIVKVGTNGSHGITRDRGGDAARRVGVEASS